MTIEKIVQLGKYPVANGSLFETTRFQMQLLYVPVGFQIHMLQIEFFLAYHQCYLLRISTCVCR